jgi:DNA-3-methyladenine glycosylase II
VKIQVDLDRHRSTIEAEVSSLEQFSSAKLELATERGPVTRWMSRGPLEPSMQSEKPKSKTSRARLEEASGSPDAIPDSIRWLKAIRHLRRCEPRLREVIQRVGPCRLTPQPDRFGTLVHAIIAQQISTRAAASIQRKLHLLSGLPVPPQRLLALGDDELRTAGLSTRKMQTIRSLAEAVQAGAIPLDLLDDSWSDARIVAMLTTIPGIGVWTAEMFLIFSLNRPDVLPCGDLGLRSGLRELYELDEMPPPKACFTLTEHWRPYRSVATWYLWRRADALVFPAS